MMPKAMLFASETVRVFVHKQRGVEDNWPRRYKAATKSLEAKKDYEHDGAFMREGTDYDKSSATTATGATIMLINAVATACKMLLENFDIASAYSYSPIEENVYEEPFQVNLDPSKCFLLRTL